MKVSLLKKIEELLGNSYQLLEETRSKNLDLGSLDYNITTLKTLIRGGVSTPFCVVPHDPLDPEDTSGKVGTTMPPPNGDPLAVSVATTSVLFNGKKVVIPAATSLFVGDADAVGESPVFANDHFYAAIVARDTTRFGVPAATYSIIKGFLSSNKANIPSIPYFTPPLALVRVNNYGIHASDIYNDYFYKSHYEFGADDELVRTLFVSLDNVEETLKSSSVSSIFDDIARSLDSYCNLKFSEDFKTYCKRSGYVFSNDYFRKLYSDCLRKEISVPMTEAYATTFVNYPNMTFRGANLEAVVKTSSFVTTPANLEFYALRPTSFKLTGFATTTDATICVDTTESWPNNGFLCIKSNDYVSVHTYSKLSPTMVNVSPVPTNFNVWSDVYLADKHAVAIPSGIAARQYVVPVGTSASLYVGAVNATFSTVGVGVYSVLIRNS